MIGLLYDDDQVGASRFFIDRIRMIAQQRGAQVELVVVTPSTETALLTQQLGNEFDIVLSRTRRLDLLADLALAQLPVVNRPTLTRFALDKASIPSIAQQAQVRHLPVMCLGTDHRPTWEGPVISKPRFGHGGRDVNRHESLEEALANHRSSVSNDWIIQPFAPTAHIEFRAYVVGSSLRWLLRKQATDGLRANRSHRASIRSAEPDSAIEKFIARVVSVLGEGYYGVDFFYDADGLVLNEIEDPVGARAIYELDLGDPAAELLDLATRMYS